MTNVYTYDNLQRLTRVDQIDVMGGNTVAEKRVDFAYNAAGQFTSLTRYKDTDGGGTHLVATTAYGYDDIGRLTDLTQTHDTTTIADYDWTFDAHSRITSLSFTSLVGNDGDSDYTYDDTGQLTDADHDYQTDEAYTYDENGNRTNGSYSTGDNNLLSTDGTYNYSYDDEGNRVLKANISTGDYTEYEWDHRNRLVKITQKNSSNVVTHEVEYTYDVFNRRITKEIDADGAGGGGVDTIQYMYDNDEIILAFDGSDALTNRYLHGPMVDQILADEDATGDVIWPLADNLSSIRDIVDSTGSVVNHLTYDAYGNVTSETAPTVDHIYAYTGRERDYESDLQFNRARYYDPLIGQWISEDPISFVADDDNLRRYVQNSPVNYSDPTGNEGSSALSFGLGVLDYVSSSVNPGAAIANGLKQGVADFQTVYNNGVNNGYSTGFSIYAAGGTVAGNVVGLTNLSDSVHNNAAVDGHEQSLEEKLFKGALGAFQLVTAAVGGAKLGAQFGVKGGPNVCHIPFSLRGVVGNRADLHIKLREGGFIFHGTTKGGYVRYRHPNGSEVWIRPNGEVIRTGPKVTPSGGGKPYNPRIDASGNRIDTHNPGEFVDPLPGHGGVGQ